MCAQYCQPRLLKSPFPRWSADYQSRCGAENPNLFALARGIHSPLTTPHYRARNTSDDLHAGCRKVPQPRCGGEGARRALRNAGTAGFLEPARLQSPSLSRSRRLAHHTPIFRTALP